MIYGNIQSEEHQVDVSQFHIVVEAEDDEDKDRLDAFPRKQCIILVGFFLSSWIPKNKPFESLYKFRMYTSHYTGIPEWKIEDALTQIDVLPEDPNPIKVRRMQRNIVHTAAGHLGVSCDE